ncbi:MAG: hypothetical protein ABL908_20175, partial [Hyphomicrobium sp.]
QNPVRVAFTCGELNHPECAPPLRRIALAICKRLWLSLDETASRGVLLQQMDAAGPCATCQTVPSLPSRSRTIADASAAFRLAAAAD